MQCKRLSGIETPKARKRSRKSKEGNDTCIQKNRTTQASIKKGEEGVNIFHTHDQQCQKIVLKTWQVSTTNTVVFKVQKKSFQPCCRKQVLVTFKWDIYARACKKKWIQLKCIFTRPDFLLVIWLHQQLLLPFLNFDLLNQAG